MHPRNHPQPPANGLSLLLPGDVHLLRWKDLRRSNRVREYSFVVSKERLEHHLISDSHLINNCLSQQNQFQSEGSAFLLLLSRTEMLAEFS